MGAGRVRVGFVGCGNHATTNIYPSLNFVRDMVDLVAVADLKEELAQRNARVFGARQWFRSHEEMIEKAEIDAAIVVTPVGVHVPIVLDCLNAGLHVFVEKPLSDTLEGARRVLDASTRTGRHVMVAFMKRFIPTYLKAKEVSDGPGFGRHFIQTKYCSGRYPTYSDHLLDYTVHHFDLVRFFMGEPVSLYALMSRPSPESELASIGVSVRFRDGGVGQMHTGSAELWSQLNERVEVVGAGRFIVVDNYIDFKVFDDSLKPLEMSPLKPCGLYWTPNFPIPGAHNQSYVLNGYVGELEHFATSLLEGRKPVPSDYDGYRALQMVFAARESIEKGEVVRVPEA